MTDEKGRIVWTADYAPFGRAAVDADPDGDGRAFVLHLRLPGQWEDPATGLHYNLARWYDPGTERYLSPDPLGLAAGPNPYAYAAADPVNRIDPLGLITAFIGGAGDKYRFWGFGPTGIMDRLREAVAERVPAWIAKADLGLVQGADGRYRDAGFGYYGWRGGMGWNPDARAEVGWIVQDIVAAVRRNPCSERVRIVAHSYGARIATEVVFRLAAYGIPVDLLITLDPVGDAYPAEGLAGVPGKANEAGEGEEDDLDFDFESEEVPDRLPVPEVGLWINVQSKSGSDPSDWIAGVGGRWGDMGGIADENVVAGVAHENAEGMMNVMLSSGETLMDLLVGQILVQYGSDG